MNDLPATDDLTITPDERRLCIVYALLWTGVFPLAFVVPDFFPVVLGEMASWMREQTAPLLGGRLPDFSTGTMLQLIGFSFVIGFAILGVFHLAYLVKFGRWLRPATLWFWTMLHALLPVLFGLVLAVDYLLEFIRTGRSNFDFGFFVMLFILLCLSSPSFYICLGLWRRRRAEEMLRAE